MLDPRMPCTILIVEDERVLREELRFQLAQHGFVVEAFASAEEFDQRLPWVARKNAVLDIGLEGEDGLSMCRRLRAQDPLMGIVFITARNLREDRLSGLAQGADAYLVKPIDVEELVLVLRNLAQKSVQHELAASPEPWLLSAHGWELIGPDGTAIGLTAREHQTLQMLIQASGGVVAKRHLAESIFGNAISNGEQRLEVLLSRLRAKARSTGNFSLPIRSAHASGYAFTSPAKIG